MVKVKSCPHCNGALYLNWHFGIGHFWSCMNCARDFYPRR